MRKSALSLLVILTLNSCASILNGRQTTVKISTDRQSKIVYQKDTISINEEEIILRPNRSKKTLVITVLKDSLRGDFYLKRKTSGLFWANIIHSYGVGMLVDLTNNKRFTYPHNIHFTTDSISKKIIISNEKIALLPKNTFFINTSPLQAFDFFSIPMATLGAEYFIQDNISLSAGYGIKFKNTQTGSYNISYLKDNAISYRFETKFYNIINFTKNVHLNEQVALEFREVKSQYNYNINYTEKENPNQNEYITDDFATKKTVTIVNLKYGLLVPLGKRFYLDFYSGFGIRIKKFNHINLEYDKLIHERAYSDLFSIFDLDGSFRKFRDYDKKSLFNYSLGIKLGIKL